MHLSFHGAAREVTGSCYLVETERSRILIDCGMFQGSAFADAKNFRDFGFYPKTISAVIVTHGHLDHIGRLPKLVKEGFRGKIYLTPPTAKIAELVLHDAEQIMQEDFRRQYRPKLYEREDIEKTVECFKIVDYNTWIKTDGFSFRFLDAGHIFGSAFVELQEKDGARMVFSGDLGNRNVPILRPTEKLPSPDVLVIESTYGNRVHEDESTREVRLREIIKKTVKQRGVLVIPAFAVERTQELLYELNHLSENRLIPSIDVYLDSPMAISVADIIDSFPEYYSNDATRLIAMGDDMLHFPGLHITKSRDESKNINQAKRPKIIIAGAGMMNGGRIQHHLVRYLSDPSSTVLIIGYQAYGTLGRRLYSGEKRVDVLGERVEVKANVMSIGAYSAHADQHMLLDWIRSAKTPPKYVYCTHGDEGAAAALSTCIKEDLHLVAHVPRFEDRVEVT